MKLIGLTGKARSGKDTLAAYAFSALGFTRIAFADPVKLAAQQVFGLSHDQTWDDNLKEVVIPYWDLTPRQMFQKLGTDATHPVFGADVWMKRWFLGYDMLKDSDDIIVPDCRYDLEAAGIRNLGGIIIELRRGTGLDGADGMHKSEHGLSIAPDYIIDNLGTVDDMCAEFNRIMGLENE